MLVNPCINQAVEIRYNPKIRHSELGSTLHGKIGRVVVIGRGKPRNHGIDIEGVMYVIPCGNINKLSC